MTSSFFKIITFYSANQFSISLFNYCALNNSNKFDCSNLPCKELTVPKEHKNATPRTNSEKDFIFPLLTELLLCEALLIMRLKR